MDRPVSSNEVQVVNWLLDHSLIDVTSYRLRPLEELRVVDGCGCGCVSLYFARKEQVGKVQMLADELAVYPDGQQADLILWGDEGKIAWLEVYDCHPEASHRALDAHNLCTWDELGGRDMERADPPVSGCCGSYSDQLLINHSLT